MPTGGFINKDGAPFFGYDDDSDGGFTQKQLLTGDDLNAYLSYWAGIGAFGRMTGFAPGNHTGALFAWTGAASAIPGLILNASVSVGALSSTDAVLSVRVAGVSVASMTIPANNFGATIEVNREFAANQRLDVVVTSGSVTDAAITFTVNTIPDIAP